MPGGLYYKHGLDFSSDKRLHPLAKRALKRIECELSVVY